MKDRTVYTAQRLLRVTEQIKGMGESKKRLKAHAEMSRDLGKMLGGVLQWFTLPYLRSPKEQRVGYQINKLINEFKRAEREELPLNPEALLKRQERLQEKIREIYKDLGEIK